MRTPGRCTNFQSCWLANGRRDIRVLVGDPFVCPVCGEPLHAPSMTSMSANGILGALSVSLALVVTAGGAGFGVVRLAQTAITTTMAALHNHHPEVEDFAGLPQDQTADSPAFAGSDGAHSPAGETKTLAATAVTTNPLLVVRVKQLASATPLLKLNSTVPAAVYVSATPAHKLVLPISFGRPQAPEDDAPARSPNWHHHGARGGGTYVVPAPGWSNDDQASIEQAQHAIPPAEGDSDEDAGSEGGAAYVAPTPRPLPAPVADSNGVVAGQQADTGAPNAIDVTGARSDSGFQPGQITRLVVPAVVQASPGLAYAPASRVDPVAASEYDRDPDAPYRLATLPKAAPAKLAVPSYPAQEAADQQSGRVDVGCVITTHGVPAACQVQRQQGGQPFAHSVMSWLSSGSVRYRPGVVSGQPVAQPRDYKVSFQP